MRELAKMLELAGLQSGVVYASGIMKAREIVRSAAEFRAQETIRPMTARILAENEKAAMPGDLFVKTESMFSYSIPALKYVDKEVSECAVRN
ncbi:hypothetical protein [Paenibacillus tyrfis]|uniref:Uncharacterized protein n=1 Tax=Paenibacillus tyrfis TaxID=1501230 RepID=A0A081NWN0_9BACL|nr:hypothetical protein [Paenibacillus tyrfis]KEQ22853.1 hypothetical protein ET33_21115 [Paenibacillus tyrfis]